MKKKIIIIISVLIFLAIVWKVYQEVEKNAEHAELMKIKDATPFPVIEVISSQDKQDNSGEYLLEFTAEGADDALITVNYGFLDSLDDKKVLPKEDGLYSIMISLESEKTHIKIKARNQYKKDTIDFTLEREETDEEADIRAESERYSEEYENSKAGKLCKTYPEWTEAECRKVADNKYWIGMSYEMLVEARGNPNSANPSDYGYGKSWQWCWTYYTPSCFYDDDDDGIIDSYN